MNKKNMQLCVASVVALGLGSSCQFAHATSVNVYGLVDMYAASSQTSSAPVRTTVLNSGGMTTSYWGIGGSEDLGGTMKAIFQIEGFLRADTGEAGRSATDPMFARNVAVGLADSWGELKIGRMTTSLFIADGAVNPFGVAIRFSPLMGHTWNALYGADAYGDSNWANSIAYSSPNMDGFKVRVHYSLGETTARSTNNASLNLSYAKGPLMLTALSQQVKNGTGIVVAGPQQNTYLLGGSYDFTSVKLYGSYDRNKTDGTGRTTKTSQLGISVPCGMGSWLLSSVHSSEYSSTVARFSRNTTAAGYDYNLSRRTDLYAVVEADKLSTASSGNSFGVGIRHRF